MTAPQDNPYLTITLTDRPPVKIKKEDWPIVAEASDKAWDNQYEFQANCISKWALRVREHGDGRAIVYAIYSYDSHYRNARTYQVRGGELLTDSSALAEAIRRVGEWASRQEQNEGGAGRWQTIINECIADLPAVDI